jgi:CO dehydrogenase nickel-insertion accessory protein CooC1
MSGGKPSILASKKIGFFGKGGAGKTTAVVLIARALVKSGYTVCIVDADSTNIGLHQALGIDRLPTPLITYYGGMIFSGGPVTCPVDDPTPLDGAKISLDELPSNYYARADAHLYLLSGGKLGTWGAGAGCDGPISKIARDIHVECGAEPVVTLVDFKAGFEDTARGVVTCMDWAIVIVDPTQASLTLALHMKKMVERVRAGQLPATEHLGNADLVALANRLFREARLRGALFVLNRVADETTMSFLTQQLAQHSIAPIATIYDDPRISDAWLKGTVIQGTHARSDVEAVVHELERAVVESTAEV